MHFVQIKSDGYPIKFRCSTRVVLLCLLVLVTATAQSADDMRGGTSENKFLEMASPLTWDTDMNSMPDDIDAEEIAKLKKLRAGGAGMRSLLELESGDINDINDINDLSELEDEEVDDRSAIEKLLAGDIEEEVSKELTQFGYDVFDGKVSTFAPVENVPVGGDYIVGPGDGFVVTVWGRINAQYRVVINRNGEVALPEVGVLRVSGMNLDKMESYLQDQFSRKHTDFRMAVTMGRLRTIRVFVVGEAKIPGGYTVSSLSTVINALFAAGGPSKNGSLRKIRLSRVGQEPVELDLYEFLLGGDKSRDVRLQDGDTIFIPVIGSVVGVAGNVKRPAIYEIKGGENLAGVLELAGGVTHAGWLQRVQLERTEGHDRRIVADFDISADGEEANSSTVVRDGDVVKVFSVTPYEQNVAYLEGHVMRPGKYEVRPGMKLSDIIRSYESLKPGANLEHAELFRLTEPDYHPVIIPLNLGELLAGYESSDVELKRYDTIRVYRWDEKGKRSVSISGEVYRPGEYRFFPGMKLSQVLEAAGGPGKNAFVKSAELTRRHITQAGMETQKIDIDLRRVLAKEPEHDILLQDYDHLIIRAIPELEFDRIVEIEGEIMFPGVYPIVRGERLSSVIDRAGGYTNRAYLRGAIFTRESAKIIQRQRMDELIREIEENMLAGTDRAISGALDDESVKTQEIALEAKKELLSKLRAARANGRVVIGLSSMEQLKGSKYDMELEKGDVLTVPEMPGIVSVMGEVFNPTSMLYEEEGTVAHYLQRVGGMTKEADKKQISVIRADGSVVSIAQKNKGKVFWDSDSNEWHFGGFMALRLGPGDTIVVPRKMDKMFLLKRTKDIVQILFQAALAAGVVVAL